MRIETRKRIAVIGEFMLFKKDGTQFVRVFTLILLQLHDHGVTVQGGPFCLDDFSVIFFPSINSQ